jgi:hypothetical protein
VTRIVLVPLSRSLSVNLARRRLRPLEKGARRREKEPDCGFVLLLSPCSLLRPSENLTGSHYVSSVQDPSQNEEEYDEPE